MLAAEPHKKNCAVEMLNSYQLFAINKYTMMKFSRPISRVKWLSGEKTNVSKTISVLVLRVLV